MREYENALDDFNGLKEYVELMATSPDRQFEWLVEHGYPTSELWNQLADAVPGWFPFMRQHIAVSRELETAIQDLLASLDTTAPECWGDELDNLRHPDWDRIRELAQVALELFPQPN